MLSSPLPPLLAQCGTATFEMVCHSDFHLAVQQLRQFEQAAHCWTVFENSWSTPHVRVGGTTDTRHVAETVSQALGQGTVWRVGHTSRDSCDSLGLSDSSGAGLDRSEGLHKSRRSLRYQRACQYQCGYKAAGLWEF